MAELGIRILNKDGRILLQQQGSDEVVFSYRGLYKPGDKIQLTCDEEGIYLQIRLDDSVEESQIYLSKSTFTFMIPFDEYRKPYGKKAFTEERHFGYARVVCEKEFYNYRNLAHNAFDQKEVGDIYPHASTNVTTDNPQFFARNAIDGICVTNNHGSWPHSSWGINGQADAWLKIDFGREVMIEEIQFYLRADFPHDNWWKEAEIVFSDSTRQMVHFRKTGEVQKFETEQRKVTWMKITNLHMSEEESLYPALSQIEVMGRWV